MNRVLIRMCLFSVIVLSTTLSWSVERQYFPEGAFSGRSQADTASRIDYSSILERAGEPPLFRAAVPSDTAIYRLLWLREDEARVLRVESMNGSYQVRYALVNVIQGERQATVDYDKTIEIAKAEWDQITRYISDMQFWTLRSVPNGKPAFDGSSVVLEGAAEGRYNVVLRYPGGLNDQSDLVFDLRGFIFHLALQRIEKAAGIGDEGDVRR